jgi:hypothetical protein
MNKLADLGFAERDFPDFWSGSLYDEFNRLIDQPRDLTPRSMTLFF